MRTLPVSIGNLQLKFDRGADGDAVLAGRRKLPLRDGRHQALLQRRGCALFGQPVLHRLGRRNQAQVAADAAALAGVDGGAGVASDIAARNGGRLVSFRRDADSVTVVVVVATRDLSLGVLAGVLPTAEAYAPIDTMRNWLFVITALLLAVCVPAC